MVHDGGRSLNERVDRGQLEGGLVQGLGWMTSEELVFGRSVGEDSEQVCKAVPGTFTDGQAVFAR
jgi:xanthine dehydrogenase molybdopterin-binding subunit B